MPKLAICGGKPLRKRPFPSWPVFSKEEERGVVEVLSN